MRKSPFQFSLAALLLTVALVAGVLALMFQVPREPARLGLIFAVVVLSALTITGAISGRPTLQTFCVGALVPLAMMLFFIASNFGGLVNAYAPFGQMNTTMDNPPVLMFAMIPRFLGVGILTSIALGYLCVGFRWFIESREG